MLYTQYNREERNICAHLFRVLHCPNEDYKILREFIGTSKLINQFDIFSEVALIRDAYHFREKNKSNFIDNIVKIIIEQENVKNCRLYSELPSILNNGRKTHPLQIRQKAKSKGFSLTLDENRVYGSLQGMFNAKPDLAIFLEDLVLVYEAKLTQNFNIQQLNRTQNIVEVWTRLLYNDLGYNSSPEYKILKLGIKKSNPDISWERIVDIVSSVLPKDDKSYLTMSSVIKACC